MPRTTDRSNRFHPPPKTLPVFPSVFFDDSLKAAAHQRKTILNLREASRGSGRMIDHPRILTQPLLAQHRPSSPIRLMTGAQMKSKRFPRGAVRETEGKRIRDDVFIDVFAAAICAVRGIEGWREGAALLARLKPPPRLAFR